MMMSLGGGSGNLCGDNARTRDEGCAEAVVCVMPHRLREAAWISVILLGNSVPPSPTPLPNE
jgi:hypothetical protein